MTDTVKKGFTLWRDKNGGYVTGGRLRHLIDNGYNTSLGKGDPVRVSGGYIVVATDGSVVTGVFDGCKYIDPNTRQTVESDLWPAGTSSGGRLEGQIDAIGYIIPAEGNSFICKADASVSAAELGLTFGVSNAGSPNTQFKRSNCVLHASANPSADNNMIQVIGFPDIAGTAADDAETIVEVVFVNTGYVTV